LNTSVKLNEVKRRILAAKQKIKKLPQRWYIKSSDGQNLKMKG